MIENKLDRMIELLETILFELKYPHYIPYPVLTRPYEQPYYTDTTGSTIYTTPCADVEAR